MKSWLYTAACIAYKSYAQTTYPPITVKVNGVDTTLYVQIPSWASSNVTVSGSGMSFLYNKRMYLSTSPTLDTTKYWKPNMLGGSFEFDVDHSKVGCGCLSGIYMVRMPSLDAGNTDPFKYCDANQVGGYWCPEFDIMESNKYGLTGTAHACPAPVNGIWSNCDRIGQCTTDVLLNGIANSYGPGT